jgi:hypothetical protein
MRLRVERLRRLRFLNMRNLTTEFIGECDKLMVISENGERRPTALIATGFLDQKIINHLLKSHYSWSSFP